MNVFWFGEWPHLDKWHRQHGKQERRADLLARAEAVLSRHPEPHRSIDFMCSLEIAAEQLLQEESQAA